MSAKRELQKFIETNNNHHICRTCLYLTSLLASLYKGNERRNELFMIVWTDPGNVRPVHGVVLLSHSQGDRVVVFPARHYLERPSLCHKSSSNWHADMHQFHVISSLISKYLKISKFSNIIAAKTSKRFSFLWCFDWIFHLRKVIIDQSTSIDI